MNNYFTSDDKIKKESKFGKWHVSKSGEMTYNNGFYYIEEDQLKDDDWIAHMFTKDWIDWNEFIPAYFQALKNANIKFIHMKVFY